MNETNKFGIKHRLQDDILFLQLGGYLDAHTAPELENSINEFIKSGRINIIVNFKELDYISSAGLGVFMAFIEEIREKKGDIKMSEMNSKVFSVFDLLGFPILFDIVDTDEIAFNKFKNGELKTNDY